MTTNKDWLNSLDSDELKAWLNADHPNDNIAPEKVVTFDYGYSNDANGDSRAQLEADITNWLGSWTAFSVPISKVKQFIFDCLDRQAAITRAGCDKPNWDYCETCELQAQLQASNKEREHWRNVCGVLIDKTHEMQSIYDEGLA